jgi:hypothetical protein
MLGAANLSDLHTNGMKVANGVASWFSSRAHDDFERCPRAEEALTYWEPGRREDDMTITLLSFYNGCANESQKGYSIGIPMSHRSIRFNS